MQHTTDVCATEKNVREHHGAADFLQVNLHLSLPLVVSRQLEEMTANVRIRRGHHVLRRVASTARRQRVDHDGIHLGLNSKSVSLLALELSGSEGGTLGGGSTGGTKCTSQRVGKNRCCSITANATSVETQHAGSVRFYPCAARYVLYPLYPP